MNKTIPMVQGIIHDPAAVYKEQKCAEIPVKSMEFLKKPETSGFSFYRIQRDTALPSPLEAKRDMLDHPHLAGHPAKSIHDYFYRVNKKMQAPFLLAVAKTRSIRYGRLRHKERRHLMRMIS